MNPIEKYVHDRCIEEGECWVWQMSCSGSGRPQMAKGRRSAAVRRELWVALHGEVPAKKWVTVSCDTERCCAPDHLALTTNRQAQKKAAKQGKFSTLSRRAKVANHKRGAVSKLTASDVIEIRASTDLLRVLADRYGVAKNTISAIRLGTRWKDYSNPFAGLMA